MKISTPGRICLFGEHQDYLGLPIIAMAISLRVKINGNKRSDNQIIIHKKDLNATEKFSLSNLNYTKSRDYFKSSIKVCKEAGINFSNGLECEITGDIPIGAGTSSSSAVIVSWIHFLSKMADQHPNWDQKTIGKLAYLSEVKEFNEPCGMMDQYTTALGNLIYLESEPKLKIKTLDPRLGTFVLGDSCEPKDTIEILKRCRDSRVSIFEKLKAKNQNSTIFSINKNANLSDLNNEEIELFQATLKNRNILKRGLEELNKENPDHSLIGKLLYKHHRTLRDILKVSTSKIDSMLDASLDAGALGGKINGSGGGGCMFAYAPENPEKVADAIKSVGGKSYIVNMDSGTKEE